jgi:HEAT repeat protein
MPGLRQWLRSKDLNSSDSEARQRAIEKVMASGGEEALDLIAPLMQDDDADVRSTAASALGEIGGPASAHHLIDQLLHERELTVRRAIADATAKLHHECTVPLLTAALDDGDTFVRQAAGWAIRLFGWEFIDDYQRARISIMQDDWAEAATFGTAAIEPLRDALIGGTNQSKRLAVETLASIGNNDAFNVLVSTMEDAAVEKATRKLAAWGLKSFCWEWTNDALLEQVATHLDG